MTASNASMAPLDIECYGASTMPPFLRLITQNTVKPRAVRFIVYWIILYSSLFLVAIFEGSAGFGSVSITAVLRDILRLVLVRTEDVESRPLFPLVRDYASLIHAWMIVVISIWCGDLLKRYSDLISSMIARGSLAINDYPKFMITLNKVNSRLRKGEVHVAVILVAVLLTLLGSLAYQRQGIYTFFQPPNSDPTAFAHAAYENWWARTFRPGSYIWIFWALVGNYVNVWIGYVSIEIVTFFYRIRPWVRLSLDSSNSDRNWGWSSAVEIISTGRKIAVAASIGLGAIALIANPSGFYYLFLFPGTFVVTIMLFMFPNALYRKARDNYVASIATSTVVERNVASIQIAIIPDRIVKTRDFVFQVVFTAIPAIIAIVQVAHDALK